MSEQEKVVLYRFYQLNDWKEPDSESDWYIGVGLGGWGQPFEYLGDFMFFLFLFVFFLFQNDVSVLNFLLISVHMRYFKGVKDKGAGWFTLFFPNKNLNQ
jgi:hypothetical protein